jgi:REP element-mobilizing transposase RayT
MSYYPEIHHRRSIRLDGYDYSEPGAYFITICTSQRELAFGDVVGGVVVLNEHGRIVRTEWMRSVEIRKEVELDTFVVMPNHVHAIVWIGPDPRKTLGNLVAGFKASVTSRMNVCSDSPDQPRWQRGYWDRIIRNERELNDIRQYIMDNPLKWAEDRNNPSNAKAQAVGASGARPFATHQKNANAKQ